MRTMKHWALAVMTAAALGLAGCGGGGSSSSPQATGPTEPTPNPAEERSAIQMALNAAGQALSVVTAAGEDATDAQIMAAETAVMRAKDAIDAADDLSDAEIAQHNTALGLIETPLMTARNDYDESQRMMDVASARSAAMQSYMDADANAEKARQEADAAEDASPGSAGAMAAETAAMKAREAADAAKAAHDAIMDDMTKAEADAEKDKAAAQAETAMTQYMTAMRENNRIQTAATAAGEQQRKNDVAAAKEAAGEAVMAAMTAKNDADAAASMAETARDDAKAAYMKAMAARTDETMAEAEYEKAKAAAMAARTAANAADTAYMAAKMAADGIMDDGTADAAKAAQKTAETEQGKAEMQQETAETEQGKAETAEMAAMKAAGTHVLQLFLAANGAHVMDDATTTADEKADHVTAVGAAMAAIAEATNGAQAGGTTASAAWPGDTVDDPATAGTDESSEGMLSITVSPAGAGDLPFELGGDREADSTVTPAVTARIQTAKKIAGLGDFQGYEVWEDDGDATTATDRGRVIVFTNKTQDKPEVDASDAVTAREIENVAVTTTTLTKLGTKSGNTYTGAEYTPTGEAALTGTLTCPSGTTCSVDATTAADGTVTINAVAGYVFTGSREAMAAVTACDATCQATANNDYLVFGLWLDEDTTTDPTNNTFGSFATGGTGYTVGPVVAVTGTAMYGGKAAGAHHKTGEGVNWFDGNASLTANFGNATDAGTISGMIDNIRVAGGDPMSAPIYLGQAALTGGTATFNGAAFMGAATAPGASTHEFDGTWSGSFFGATVDDATTGVDESVTAPLAAAGTFGVTKSEGTGDDMVVESFVGAFGAHLDKYNK